MLTPSIFVSAGEELDIFDVLRRECSCLLESLMSRLRFQGVGVRERTRLRLVVDHSLSIWPGGLHTWSSYLATSADIPPLQGDGLRNSSKVFLFHVFISSLVRLS